PIKSMQEYCWKRRPIHAWPPTMISWLNGLRTIRGNIISDRRALSFRCCMGCARKRWKNLHPKDIILEYTFPMALCGFHFLDAVVWIAKKISGLCFLRCLKNKRWDCCNLKFTNILLQHALLSPGRSILLFPSHL